MFVSSFSLLDTACQWGTSDGFIIFYWLVWLAIYIHGHFAYSVVATPVEIGALIILPFLFKIAKEPELSSLALKLTAGG